MLLVATVITMVLQTVMAMVLQTPCAPPMDILYMLSPRKAAGPRGLRAPTLPARQSLWRRARPVGVLSVITILLKIAKLMEGRLETILTVMGTA